MKQFFDFLLSSASFSTIELALLVMRVGIGILTIGHGVPKIMGGMNEWANLGTFVNPLGIYFLPVMWGFLGAATEFFGGIMLTLGLGTRVASFALIIMMIVATVWHINRGDSFNAWSFPLALIFVYFAFMIIGGGSWSVDSWLVSRNY